MPRVLVDPWAGSDCTRCCHLVMLWGPLLISAEALFCTYSNWLAGNWSASSLQTEVCLRGMVLDPYRHAELCFTSRLTVQEVKISREYENREKWLVVTWSTKSEEGCIGPVGTVHMVFSDNESFLVKTSVENLAATQLDVPFVVHTKGSAFTTGRIQSYTLFLFRRNNDDVIMWSCAYTL